jgi:hypothetical protein
MSWTVTERSQTGEVQYIIATHPDIVAVGPSGILNVSGYTKGSISFVIPPAGSAKIRIEGSLDSTNWFTINQFIPSLPPGTYKLNWLLNTKFVRLFVSTTDLTDIVLFAEY